MSDPGFPPFRSAQPKGPRVSDIEAEQRRKENRPVEPIIETTAETFDLPGAFVDPALVDEGVRKITVCAKCGSREVREAVLIGDEVYVKL